MKQIALEVPEWTDADTRESERLSDALIGTLNMSEASTMAKGTSVVTTVVSFIMSAPTPLRAMVHASFLNSITENLQLAIDHEAQEQGQDESGADDEPATRH